jgi:hypothetical protein
MPLPDVSQSISFEDINLELGNDSDAELDLQSASVLLGESDAPYGMNELANLSFNTFTYSTAGVYNFAVAGNGTVTAPVATIGTITSKVYSSGYNSGTNQYPQVSSDTTRTVTVTVQAPASGYSNNGASVTGTESATQPDTNFTFADSGVTSDDVSINANGSISVTIDEGSLYSTNPTSFEPTDTETNDNTVTVTISVPGGYANTGGTVSQTFTNITQVAAARTLELTTSDSIPDGQDTFVTLTINDVNFSNTSWTLAADGTPTLGSPSLSSTNGTGDATVTLTFSANSSGTSRSGTFIVSESGGNSDSVTINQGSFTLNPPTVSLSSFASDFVYNDTTTFQTLTGTITGGGTPTSITFFANSSDFEFVQTDSDVTLSGGGGINTGTVNSGALTQTSFTIGVRPTTTNTGGADKTVDVLFTATKTNHGNNQASATATQEYYVAPVTWSATPTSFTGADRFDRGGETQYITLSTSLSWTASVTGTGFSLSTTSGTSGTHTIGVTASANTGDTRTGTVTLSATGQTDITISLSQLYAMQDLDVSWNNGVSYEEGGDTSTQTLTNSNIYREYQIYARQDYDSTVTWEITTGTSGVVWNTGGGTTSTLDQTATVGTTPVSKIIRILANSSEYDISSAIQVSSDTSINIYYKTYTHEGIDDGGPGDGGTPSGPPPME